LPINTWKDSLCARRTHEMLYNSDMTQATAAEAKYRTW